LRREFRIEVLKCGEGMGMSITGASADEIRRWAEGLPGSLEIRFRKTVDGRTLEFERFLEDFVRCAGDKVRIVRDEGGEGELPAVVVSDSLVYQALPQGLELSPFLQLLRAGLGEMEPLPADLKEYVEGVAWPAEITVFIAPGCPHCPEAVRRIGPLALHQPSIRVTIVDASLFPETAEPFGIRAVPTVVLDGRFRWTGSFESREILEALVHRDSAQLPASMLKTLLKDGQAERLAAMMLERGEIFPAFIDLATHPEWSVRLGAVVVAEEIVESDPELARTILPALWERFSEVDTDVKGDILYLIGLAGSPRDWAGRLEEIQRTVIHEDLREAAREVLERWGASGAP